MRSADRRAAVTLSALAALLVLAGLLTGCGSSGPGVTVIEEEESAGGRVLDVALESSALGRTRMRLMLPEGFESEPDRRWPVLWLLHGCCDELTSWTQQTDIEEWPELSEVVMPDGGLVGFYSDWQDGPAWETFHTAELPALLRERWRAGDEQALAGVSMGGLGAMAYAARHPGAYRAAASFSGDLHTGLEGRSATVLGLVGQFGEDPLALWGSTSEGVWAEHNPYDLAPELEGVALYVSTGNGETGPLDTAATPEAAGTLEEDLAPETEAFVQRLTEMGIPVQFSDYGPGTHSWAYWERELRAALPLLLGTS